MIRKPCLATLVLAADPVAEELALVGIPLALGCLEVHELPLEAPRDGRIGGGAFDAHVELGHAGDMGEIDSRPPCGATGCIRGRNIVVHLGIAIEEKPSLQPGKTVGEVKSAETS